MIRHKCLARFASALLLGVLVSACGEKAVTAVGGGDGGDAEGDNTGGSSGTVNNLPACPLTEEVASPSADAPLVFWASQPVKPNQTAMVSAGRLSETASVEVARVPDCESGDPSNQQSLVLEWKSADTLFASDHSVHFVVPQGLQAGVFAYRISDGGLTGEIELLNAPDILFVQGDDGERAAPGGWIDVHGTGLGDNGEAVLMHGQKEIARLTSDASDEQNDEYRQRFLMPDDVPEGEYELFVHNGQGGPMAWTRFSTYVQEAIETVTVANHPLWPVEAVSVADQSGESDDERFAAAIAELSENGGGVLEVPAGEYLLTETIALPDHTLVRGAGMDQTTLRWTENPEQSLITGQVITFGSPPRANFSLQDLSLISLNDFDGFGIERAFTSEPGWIRRVRIDLSYDETITTQPSAIYLRGTSSTEITDSVLDAYHCILARDRVSYLRAERNQMRWLLHSIHFAGTSHALVFADNDLLLGGDTTTWDWGSNPNPGFVFNSFYNEYGPFTRDVYFAYNRSERESDEEVVWPLTTVGYTADGTRAVYTGPVTMTSPTTITLAQPTYDPTVSGSPDYDYNGGLVRILDGKGVGQWRFATSGQGASTSIDIDRPWQIEPDKTSVVSVENLFGRFLYVGNHFSTEYTDQEYYSSLDIIRAKNHYQVGDFVGVWTGSHYDTFLASWRIQYIDNIFSEPAMKVFAFQGGAVPEYSGIAAMNLIYRGNEMPTSADGRIGLRSTEDQTFADSLIEDNTAPYVYLGRTDEPLNFDGVIVRNNEASMNYGNLVDVDPATVPGVVYLP